VLAPAGPQEGSEAGGADAGCDGEPGAGARIVLTA